MSATELHPYSQLINELANKLEFSASARSATLSQEHAKNFKQICDQHNADLLVSKQNFLTEVQAKLDAFVPKCICPDHSSTFNSINEQIAQLVKRIEGLEMDNKEKHELISKLNEYYIKNHPDCVLELPDGRKVFRDDLHKYKLDLLMQDIFDRLNKAETKINAPAAIVEDTKKAETFISTLMADWQKYALVATVITHIIWDIYKHVQP